jgi:phosphoglucomutase
LPKEIAGIDVLKVTDYKDGIITDLKTGEKTKSELKDSNVIYFDMNEGSSLIARPSGTEPLIKVYFSIPAENEAKAMQKFESYKEALTKML